MALCRLTCNFVHIITCYSTRASRGGTKVIIHIFFPRSYNEICIYHGYILYKFEGHFSTNPPLFHKSSIIPQILHYSTNPPLSTHFFSPLHETLYAGRVKLFPETSQLFTQPVSQLVVAHKTSSPECILQGINKMEVGGC